MVKKRTPVNSKSNDLLTIGGRLASERGVLKLKQVDLCIRLNVSKTTQIKYESGQSFPDAQYLSELAELGFDVLYILTGARSTDAMSDECQNLIEAYEDAHDALKRAAFAVLLSPYLPEPDKARRIAGYYRHEIAGEEDVRYEAHREKQRLEDKQKDGK